MKRDYTFQLEDLQRKLNMKLKEVTSR
jgi:hypothetical protein